MEGHPCHIVFCHADDVFLPKAADSVLLVPGAKHCCLVPTIPHSFFMLLLASPEDLSRSY